VLMPNCAILELGLVLFTTLGSNSLVGSTGMFLIVVPGATTSGFFGVTFSLMPTGYTIAF